LYQRLLKRANSTYFEPRGLKVCRTSIDFLAVHEAITQVRLMKTGAMRRFVGIDTPGSEPGKAMQIAKKVGHGLESVSSSTLSSL
jgi:hypothetical protein